jgi:hypothetical protein
MVNDLSDTLLDSVCHYLIEDFYINIHYGDWPVVFGCAHVQFWDEVILASYNELGSAPSLSISWKSLRSVGISSYIKVC